MQPHGSSKTIWIIIAVLVLAAASLMWYYQARNPAPLSQEAAPADTQPPAAESTADIEAELQGIGVEGLDAELSDIEQELSQ